MTNCNWIAIQSGLLFFFLFASFIQEKKGSTFPDTNILCLIIKNKMYFKNNQMKFFTLLILKKNWSILYDAKIPINRLQAPANAGNRALKIWESWKREESTVLTHKMHDATLISNRPLHYSSSCWETDSMPELSTSAFLNQCSLLCKGKTKSFQYYKGHHSVRFLVKLL